MRKLPRGWAYATFSDLFDRFQYGLTSKADKSASGTRFVRITDIQDGAIDWGSVPGLVGQHNIAKYLLADGDFVFARSGSIEKAARIASPPESVFASYLIRGRPLSSETSDYLSRFIRSDEYLRNIAERAAGIGMSNVNAAKLSTIKLPLPPLKEQRIIVAKIDNLADRSKRARDQLDHIPRLVEKYKQALLVAAFSGGFRAKSAGHRNRVSEALDALRREHRAQKTISAGAIPEALFRLPPHWCWTTAEMVVEPGAEIVYGIVQPGPRLTSGIPYVRGTDIQNGCIKLDQLLFTSEEIAARYERASLRGGDILLGIIRATKVAIVPDELTGGNITQGTARFRPSRFIRTRFLARWLESRPAQDWLHSKYRGIDMPGLNLRDVRQLPVPLPPIQDQELIETGIDTAFAWIDRLASEAASARKLIDRLDQAVLAKAFRGELAPQDPTDEPATVLLERIKAERKASPKARRGRTGKAGP